MKIRLILFTTASVLLPCLSIAQSNLKSCFLLPEAQRQSCIESHDTPLSSARAALKWSATDNIDSMSNIESDNPSQTCLEQCDAVIYGELLAGKNAKTEATQACYTKCLK